MLKEREQLAQERKKGRKERYENSRIPKKVGFVLAEYLKVLPRSKFVQMLPDRL